MIISELADIPAPTVIRGLVPTMGALHEGHLSLIRSAKKENQEVVVSVFVNPTQFGPSEDFEKYPRQLERDTEMALNAGADWIFAPTVREMYPRRTTKVVVDEVTQAYEGAKRPGHFDGVATVVLKLFNIVRPATAYFGLKDLQQCQVIRRMVEDLNVPVDLRFQETVRESDGLAMSSRNAYLSPEQRQLAPLLYGELTQLRDRLRKGSGEVDLQNALAQAKSRLTSAGFVVDYLDLIDLLTMQPASTLEGERALAVAAKIGNTRLIDNVLLQP